MDGLAKIQKDVDRIQINFENHALSDSRFQSDSAERDISFDKRLASIEKKVESIPSSKEVGDIVAQAITEFFSKKGKITITVITTTAIIVASLATVLGGFKVLAAFLFFKQ